MGYTPSGGTRRGTETCPLVSGVLRSVALARSLLRDTDRPLGRTPKQAFMRGGAGARVERGHGACPYWGVRRRTRRPPAPRRSGQTRMETETMQTEQTPNTGAARAEAHNAAEAARAAARRAERAEWNEAALIERYPHIDEVVERGPNGPTRVVVRCDDPQTRAGAVICTGLREIAVQDLFQVHRCEACQTAVVRKARRTRAAERDKALRAELKALRAQA